MHFNRFQIELQDEGVIARFGFVSEGQMVDSYACFTTRLDIEMNRDRLKTYIEKLPESPYEPQHLPEFAVKEIPTFRFIQASRSQDSAELMFLSFPLFAAVSAKKDEDAPKEIECDAVALLSSGRSIHQAFIIELMEHAI